MKKITLSLLLGFLCFFGFSQIGLVENFDSSLGLPAGWTGGQYGGTIFEVCNVISVRSNMSDTDTTDNLTSPNITGQSNGTDLTISFDYKIVDWSAATDPTSPGWGEMNVQYSTNNGSTWTTIGTIDDSNHVASSSCATMNFTVPAASLPLGSDFKLRFLNTWLAGDYYFYIDNVTATQVVGDVPSCVNMTMPTNNATAVSINTSLSWTAATGIPTGYVLTVGTTPGGNDVIDNLDVGLSTFFDLPELDYSTTYYVNIVPYNDNGPAVDCPEFTFTTGADPNAPVDCDSGIPVNTVYCYTNNDTTTWNFQSSSGGPLNVFFNAGGIESCCDDILIYDGIDNTGTLLYADNNGGDLTGLSINTTSGFLYIEIDSDSSVSCDSNSTCCTSPWDFDVSCIDTTAVPNCNATLTTPTNGATDVDQNVDLVWSPASVLVTGYILSVGTTPGGTDLLDNVDVGNVTTYDLGTLAYETTYYVTIIPYNDNGNATGCSEQVFTTRNDPNQIVDCSIGEIINTTYCYNSNENESVMAFYFSSSDGGPLFLNFNSGEVENGWDELYVLDSDGTNLNATTPYGAGGNLAGLSFTSTGSSLTIYVESDGSVSCQSSTSIDPWDFDVSCVDTSVVPNCNASLTSPVDGATGVNENEDLVWSPATIFVTGYTLYMGTTPGGTDVLNGVDVGNVTTYDPGVLDFSTTYYVTIIPYNDNGDATGCTEESFTTRADPFQIVDCSGAGVINTTYCYDNNENESVMAFSFASSDGSPLFIIFNSGEVENGWDELYIIDSDGTTNLNAGTPYGNAGNLTGLSYTATGSSLTVYVESDGSGSCQSSTAIDSWDFDVMCVDTTVVPNCDATLTSPTDGSVEINENDDIFWSPATVLVTGYMVSIGTTPGGTNIADNVDVGNVTTYDPGTLPYATTIYVTIVPYNDNGPATGCIEESFVIRDDPNVIVDCGAGAVNTTYCYDNNEDESVMAFYFTSDTGFPLVIDFNAGQVENGWDELYIIDSDGTTNLNAATPYGNAGNLAGLTYTSSGDTITVYVVSDGVGSCASSGYTPWDFDVYCLTCIPQSVDFDVVNGDCNTDPDNPTFEIAVNITDMGDATSLTIEDNIGNPGLEVFSTGTYTVGPYTANLNITITVSNTNDPNCVLESAPLTFLCPPAPNPCSVVYAGEDDAVACDDPSIDLTANYHIYGQDTNTYEINSLGGCPLPGTTGGTPTSLDIDDEWSEIIDLGFEFCFFGETYDQILIGSNGVLSFELENAGTGNGWAFTESLPNSTNATLSEANIFGVAHDIDPGVCGDINYMILGAAPARQFVVNYTDVCHFSCNSIQSSSQIILYEGSNAIDVNIFDKPTCSGWNSGNAVVGVQNVPGNVAFTPPGRNTGVWTATDESWRFTPSAGAVAYSLEWTDDDGNVIGDTDTVTVTPTEPTTYTASITYELCTGGTATLSDDVFIDVTGGGSSEDASFTLTPGCTGATATITGDIGGTFVFNPDPADGSMIDATTGEITNGVPGSTYTVDYTTSGACPATSTESVTLLPVEDASFTLTAGCTGATATVTGDVGGMFSFNPDPADGALIDSTTGEITNGFPGSTYTVDYTTSGACPTTSTESVTLILAEDASFTLTPDCTGATATITGDTGGTFAFSPDPADGAMIDATTGEITNGVPGSTYTVDYTTAGACPTTSTESVTLLPAEDASFTLTAGCTGATATVTGDVGGTFTFNPDPADGALIDATTGEITNGVPGSTYTIDYTTSGACPTTSTESVTLLPVEDASFTLTAGCTGATATITGDMGGTFTFNPDPADGAIIDATTGEITNGVPGAIYTVDYTTSGMCATTSTQSVIILPTEDASFTLTAGCTGATATITGDTGGTFTFNLDPADGAMIDATTGEITNGVPGSTYTVDYMTGGLCPETSTESVTILPAEDASFTLTATCDGAIANITGDSGGIFSFNPDPADGAMVDPINGEIVGGLPDTTYTVDYMTSGPCPTVSTESVTTLSASDASFTIEPSVCGALVTSITESGGVFSFADDPNDGAEIDASTGEITGGTIGTTYEVEYTVGINCPQSSIEYVTVEVCVIPQVITPNGDNANDYFDLRGFDVNTLEIFNRYGTKVYSKTNYTDEFYGMSDDGDELPTGTYFYVMKYQGDKQKTAWLYINREK